MSKKTFHVMVRLTTIHGVQVQAEDEDQARSRALRLWKSEPQSFEEMEDNVEVSWVGEIPAHAFGKKP